MTTARITLELSGKTLDNLLYLAMHLERHPDDLTVDLLHAAIESSMHSVLMQTPNLVLPSPDFRH
ncbi:MAG: hypothetical protein GXY53_09130 [Desulfobulbus sp.]|nr:hypothetical protein [Desulfobulbus sp.]